MIKSRVPSTEFIHCEHCGVAWPTEEPGLLEHEADCANLDEAQRALVSAPEPEGTS